MKFKWTLLPMIIFFLSLFMLTRCTRSIDKPRLEKVGQNLVKLDTTLEHPVQADIVSIGPGLRDKLRGIRAKATSYSFKITNGDLGSYGANEADCILTIENDISDIAIRLKYNKALNKYEILGWKTVRVKL